MTAIVAINRDGARRIAGCGAGLPPTHAGRSAARALRASRVP